MFWAGCSSREGGVGGGGDGGGGGRIDGGVAVVKGSREGGLGSRAVEPAMAPEPASVRVKGDRLWPSASKLKESLGEWR